MNLVRTILVELVNPSLDNPPAWYKWASNKISHVFLGALAAWVLVTVVFFVKGEYPYKEALWALIFVGYLCKEILFDKWKKWDTVQDIVFFAGFSRLSDATIEADGSFQTVCNNVPRIISAGGGIPNC